MTKERKPHWTEVAGFLLLGFLILGCFFLYITKVDAANFPNNNVHSTTSIQIWTGQHPHWISLGNGWSGHSTQQQLWWTAQNDCGSQALWYATTTVESTSECSKLNYVAPFGRSASDPALLTYTNTIDFNPDYYYYLTGTACVAPPFDYLTMTMECGDYSRQNNLWGNEWDSFGVEHWSEGSRTFTPYMYFGLATSTISWISPQDSQAYWDFQWWNLNVQNWDATSYRVIVQYHLTSSTQTYLDNSYSYTNTTSTSENILVWKDKLLGNNIGYTKWCATGYLTDINDGSIISQTDEACFNVRAYQYLTDTAGSGFTTSTNGAWGIVYPPSPTSGVSISVSHCWNSNFTNCDNSFWDYALNIIGKMSSYPPIGYIYAYVAKFQDLKQGTSSYSTINLSGGLDPILSPIRTAITAALWIGFAVYVVRRVKYMAT